MGFLFIGENVEELAVQPEAFKLSNQEKLFYDSLNKMDSKFGKWYLGSLMVLADANNPDRLALAAHNLRELMEKLPEHMDAKTKSESLRVKVQNLCAVWNKHVKKIKSGEKKIVLTFLQRFEEFLVWFEDSVPKRKEGVSKALKQFEPKGLQLPPPLEEMRVIEWNKIWDYFIYTAHHREKDDLELFLKWKEAFEKFLLDRLSPRTFEDQADLQALIEKGEANADA
ncbi:MAG: hypothetical protein ACREBJ_12110 [Nitrosotalea sp.]